MKENICKKCIYNPPSSCDEKPCSMCPACGKEIATNADRIRAMSDEELAVFWAKRYASAVFLEKEEAGIKLNEDQKQSLIVTLYRTLIRYLKEPITEEETP